MITVHAPPEHYQRPIVRYGLRLFALALVAIAIFSAGPVMRSILDARASVKWPSVVGTVRVSQVDEQLGPKPSYSARVEYIYVVDGKNYSHHAVSFRDMGSKRRGDAEALAAKYPVDSQVSVYHSPTDPQNAVLEPGAPPRVYLMALIPPGMLLLAVYIWRVTRRQVARAAT